MNERRVKQYLAELQAHSDGGNARSKSELAAIYATGEFGVAVNLKRAAKLYFEAARQGYRDAQYNLGLMYLHGEGVTKNVRRALIWLEKSAKQGQEDAQVVLGPLYASGNNGVRRDPRKALKWYRIAARKGHSWLQVRLGLMYLEGIGVKKNKRAGRYWIRKAAKEGDKEAKRLLRQRKKLL